MRKQMILPEKYRFNEPVGTKKRFTHSECGDHRNSLVVLRVNNGFVFHCHHCQKFSGRHRWTDLGPSQIIEQWNGLTHQPVADDKGKQQEIITKLPPDVTKDLPTKAINWLSQYQITPQEISEYDIWWSEALNRLIFPIKNKTKTKLLAYQGRWVDDLDKSTIKWYTVYEGVGRAPYFRVFRGSNKLVVVEDIVSAIKTGRFVDSLALLGSHMPDNFYLIARKYQCTYIWLDANKYKEAMKFANKLRGMGVRTVVLYTDEDPKAVSGMCIQKLLHC